MDWTIIFNGQEGVILPLWDILVHIIIAIVIAMVGIFLGRLLGKGARHVVEKLYIKDRLRKAGIQFKPELIAENIVKYVTYIGAGIIALNYLGITPVILNIIFAGLIIIVILAIFLGLKDFVPNIISGTYIISTGKVIKGNKIKVGNVSGLVKSVSLSETTLSSNGSEIIIPNSTVMKEKVEIKNPGSEKKKKK